MRPYDEDESLRDYLVRVVPGQVPTETPGVYQAVPVADVKRVQARVQIEVEGLPRLVIPNLDVQFLGLYRDMREAFSMFPPNRVVMQPPVHFEFHGMPLPDAGGTLYGLDIQPRKDTPH